MYSHSFIIISPWKRTDPFILTNLNPGHSPKDSLCKDWVKLAQFLFWRQSFLNFVNIFSLFRYYLPLEKDRLLLWTNLGCFVRSWLKLAKWFWKRRRKCDKFTTTMTDNGQIVIRKARAHYSLWLRWTSKLPSFENLPPA